MTENLGFADLGLENPGSYELPSYGIKQGTHRGFIKAVEFKAKNDDATKKNLVMTYEVDEPGNPEFGKTAVTYNACNPSDDAKTKGYLVSRLNDLGVRTEDIPSFNPRSLVGTPVYITTGPQRNNPQYMEVKRVQVNTDGEHVSVPNPPVGSTGSHAAPAAVSSVDY